MKEGLNANPKYAEKVAQVRDLSSNGVSGIETKEQAKLLRMEFMLDNAKCAKLTTSFLAKNPTVSPEKLKKFVTSTGLISNPIVVENFINQLISERARVISAAKAIERRSIKTEMSLADTLFYQWYNRNPKGKLELVTDYPLSLVLYVENDEDFAELDDRSNVGGYYQHRRYYASPKSPSHRFPLIVIRGKKPVKYDFPSFSKKITSHEKGHAEHRALVDSFTKSNIKVIWSKKGPDQDFKLYNATNFLKSSSASLEELRKSKEWGVVLDDALGRAKDELLAEYRATKGSTSNHYYNLITRKGLYDYFQYRFGEADKKLYEAFWEDYDKILKKAQDVIWKIYVAYDSSVVTHKSLKGRVKIMRWVLAQIPIRQWGEQMEGTLFYEEMSELKYVDTIMIKIMRWDDRSETDPQQQLCKKLLEELENNVERPLLPLIRKFKTDIAELRKQEAK